MTDVTVREKLGAYAQNSKVRFLAMLTIATTTLATSVSAASVVIDWDVLTGLLSNLSSEVIPAMVDFIIAIVPAIVVLSVVGFVITFLDKILSIFDRIL